MSKHFKCTVIKKRVIRWAGQCGGGEARQLLPPSRCDFPSSTPFFKYLNSLSARNRPRCIITKQFELSTTKMATIKLFYFKSRGLAEVSRLLLAASGVEWEDVRFSWEDWPKFQPDAPFGQAPYLVYNGKTVSQSVAIANFLAREFGFYGKSNLDALRIDEVICLVQDLVNCERKVYFEKDEVKKAELLEKLKTEDIPKFFGFFQKLLKESGTGYFVGDKMTVADLAVYDRIISMQEMWKIAHVDEGYPELQELHKRVEEHPNIHKYIEEHKAKVEA